MKMVSTALERLRRHRLTVSEYLRMGEARILAPDARVELIEGEIFDMAPIGSLHAGTVTRLGRMLERAVGVLHLCTSKILWLSVTIQHPSLTWRCCAHGRISILPRTRGPPMCCS